MMYIDDSEPQEGAPESAQEETASTPSKGKSKKMDDINFEQAEAKSAQPTAGESAIAQAIYDVPVQITAVLGQVEMPVNELLSLGRGAIVQLDKRVGDPVELLVNDRLVARGEVVLVEQVLGLTITELVGQSSN